MNSEVAARPARPPISMPVRSRSASLVPLGVLTATLALVGWSAWPVLRPAPTVVVVQAVHTPSQLAQAASEVPESRSNHARGGRSVQAAGWLEPEPFVHACVALADGVIESVEVLAGDPVDQGQVVARLHARDSEIRLRSAQAQIALAQAALGASKADLRGAQAAWDHPIELERAVASGRAALRESRAELDQIPALLDSARATLVRLEEEFERVQVSRLGNAATELELISARQRAIAQRAEVAALVGRGPILAARVERLAADALAAERALELRIDDRRTLELAQASVDRSLAAMESAAAAHEEAALELERMEIRSPLRGYVQRRLKSPGDKVVRDTDDPHSAHILHVYDPQHLQARVDVPLADVGEVHVGQMCEIVVEVLPGRTFLGEVLRVAHEADIQKNSLQVKVAVRDPSPLLRPEMLTRVTFLPGAASPSSPASSRGAAHFRVPAGCLDERTEHARVWAVRDRANGRGVLRPLAVSVHVRDEEWVEVSGPLQPGEMVARVEGTLREGRTVRFAGSVATRETSR